MHCFSRVADYQTLPLEQAASKACGVSAQCQFAEHMCELLMQGVARTQCEDPCAFKAG